MTEARTHPFCALDSLHVSVYDAMHTNVPGGDDFGFYREVAEQSGGPVLELGAGTGRLAIPLAEAGYEIVGIDRSAPMLRVAEAKRRAMSPAVRRRLRFVEGDMTGFRLGRRFGLAFAAFRVFMSLLDPAAQRACLAAVRRHLRPLGLLAIDVFDPLLDRVTPGIHPPEERASSSIPRQQGVSG
jgi:SAM-dependent methyltransferase